MAYKTTTFDDEIVQLLKQGGLGLLPSDTIYGLSCQALDETTVERIRRLKGRKDKPFIILISDVKMLDLLSISDNQTALVKKYWPGPLSVVFQSAAADYLTRGSKSLAVRLPDYPELLALINKTGPLVSTSVNLQGEPPATSMAEARKLFEDKLDFYVDVGPLDNPPSTVVAITDGKLQVIRPGAVDINT